MTVKIIGSISDIKDIFSKVAYSMSDSDTRYYLKGICLEITEKERFLVSTCGYTMGIVNLHDYPSVNIIYNSKKDFKVIISNHVVKEILKLKNSSAVIEIIVKDTDKNKNKGNVSISYNDKSIGLSVIKKYDNIDAAYPDWRKIIPSNNSKLIYINCNFLSSIAKTFGKNKPLAICIDKENPKNPMYFLDKEGNKFIIMPMNLNF